MKDKNRNPILEIEVRQLRVHPTAQRALVSEKVGKFEKTLDLDALGTFHAVRYEINGETAYWLVDGHHRQEALLRAGLGEWVVHVEVHVRVTTDRQASDLFLKLNDRTFVQALDHFLNALQRGDPDAVGIDVIVRRWGFQISRQATDGNIACVNSLRRAYSYGPGALDLTLRTAQWAWGRKASAVEGKLIEGLALFFFTHGLTYDEPALVKKLAKYPGGPSALLGNAKGLRMVTGRRLDACVAALVRDLYNRGRSTGRLSE